MKRESVLAILLSTALTVSTVTPVTAVAAEEPVLQTSQEELPAITDVGTEVNDLVDVSLEQTDEAAGNFRIVFTPDKEMADQFTKFTGKIWIGSEQDVKAAEVKEAVPVYDFTGQNIEKYVIDVEPQKEGELHYYIQPSVFIGEEEIELERLETTVVREAAKEEAAPVSEETQEAEIESRSSQMEITASVNASEKSVQITASGVEGEISKVQFPVWSEQNGQDDIVWYAGVKQEDGTWTVSVPVKNHKSTGNYAVHVYGIKDGKQQFLKATSFSISAPTMEQMSAGEISSNESFRVELQGVSAVSGVQKVMVPVWSQKDQSDLVWYEAKKAASGTYYADVKLKNHQYNEGTYSIHAYVTDENGIQSFVGGIEKSVSKTAGNYSAEEKDDSWKMTLSDASVPGGIKSIKYAVWSEKNGQDDIVWYESEKKGGSYTAEVKLKNHKSLGTYIVHVYAENKAGKMIILQANTFSVQSPKAGNVEITSKDINKGTFTVKVSGITNSSAVREVLVPVWCAADQSDIKWYTASRQSDGSYEAEVNIKNHKYHAGTYTAHIYFKDITGDMNFEGSTSCEMLFKAGDLSVKDTDGTQKRYQASIKNAEIPGGAKEICFAVWSETGGQDDIVWYTAKNGTANIEIKNHKTAGKYNVHAYAVAPNGDMIFLKGTTFNVDAMPGASSVQASNIDGEKGTFNVKISDILAPAGVSKVEVPVWCAGDQSDIKWYTANKNSDGTYSVDVEVKNHKNHFGTYQVHAYVTMENGIRGFVGATTASISAKNYIAVETIDASTVKVTVYNPNSGNVESVEFPTWSETGGQDDIVWYQGTRNRDGSWSATISADKHQDGGKFITHVYANYQGQKIGIGAVSYNLVSGAAARVNKHVNNIYNQVGRDLNACYWWCVNNLSYQTLPIHVTPPAGYTRDQWYSIMAFEQHRGNCFVYAAAFYQLAKGLGYDAQYVEGQVGMAAGGYGPHGWVIIRMNGASYICDPEAQDEIGRYNFYMQPVGNTVLQYKW